MDHGSKPVLVEIVSLCLGSTVIGICFPPHAWCSSATQPHVQESANVLLGSLNEVSLTERIHMTTMLSAAFSTMTTVTGTLTSIARVAWELQSQKILFAWQPMNAPEQEQKKSKQEQWLLKNQEQNVGDCSKFNLLRKRRGKKKNSAAATVN